jgi:hypothetical protein
LLEMSANFPNVAGLGSRHQKPRVPVDMVPQGRDDSSPVRSAGKWCKRWVRPVEDDRSIRLFTM